MYIKFRMGKRFISSPKIGKSLPATSAKLTPILKVTVCRSGLARLKLLAVAVLRQAQHIRL